MTVTHINPVVNIKDFGFIPKSLRKQSRYIDPRDYRIFCYDKLKNMKPRTDSIRNVCIENNFYPPPIEKYLNVKVETDYFREAKKTIIKNESIIQVTKKQKEAINTFILPQIIRTQSYLDTTEHLNKYIKKLPSSIFLNSLDYQYGKIKNQSRLPNTITGIKQLQLDNIRMASKVPFILDSFKWMLYINKTKIPFFTSDNPIINRSHIYFRNGYIYEINLKNTLKWIFFPLNPKLSLLIFKPIGFKLLPYLTKIAITNEKIIYQLNNKMIYNADREVLMSSYNRFMLKMTIAVNPNCLSQKNYNFQYLKINKRHKKFLYLINAKNPMLMCQICGRVFKKRVSFNMHDRIKHKDKS